MDALLNAIHHMDAAPDARRIFHGRGGLYPGCEHWALDAYPPVFLLTSFQPATQAELTGVHTALAQRWQQLAPEQPLNWVMRWRLARRSVHT